MVSKVFKNLQKPSYFKHQQLRRWFLLLQSNQPSLWVWDWESFRDTGLWALNWAKSLAKWDEWGHSVCQSSSSSHISLIRRHWKKYRAFGIWQRRGWIRDAFHLGLAGRMPVVCNHFEKCLIFISFWVRRGETELEQERGRERERQKPKQAPGCQHRARCRAWTHEPWDHDLSWSWTLNRLRHQGARVITVCYLLVRAAEWGQPLGC